MDQVTKKVTGNNTLVCVGLAVAIVAGGHLLVTSFQSVHESVVIGIAGGWGALIGMIVQDYLDRPKSAEQ